MIEEARQKKTEEEKKAHQKEYYEAHKDTINAKRREKRAQNPEEYNAKQRERRAKNREAYNAKERERRAKNREAENARQRERRANMTPEQHEAENAKARERRANMSPEQRQAENEKRRARYANNPEKREARNAKARERRANMTSKEREDYNAKRREKYANDPEYKGKVVALGKKWRDDNPEKLKQINKLRHLEFYYNKEHQTGKNSRKYELDSIPDDEKVNLSFADSVVDDNSADARIIQQERTEVIERMLKKYGLNDTDLFLLRHTIVNKYRTDYERLAQMVGRQSGNAVRKRVNFIINKLRNKMTTKDREYLHFMLSENRIDKAIKKTLNEISVSAINHGNLEEKADSEETKKAICKLIDKYCPDPKKNYILKHLVVYGDKTSDQLESELDEDSVDIYLNARQGMQMIQSFVPGEYADIIDIYIQRCAEEEYADFDKKLSPEEDLSQFDDDDEENLQVPLSNADNVEAEPDNSLNREDLHNQLEQLIDTYLSPKKAYIIKHLMLDCDKTADELAQELKTTPQAIVKSSRVALVRLKNQVPQQLKTELNSLLQENKKYTMKQKIRLTESQLHNVIKESVKRILKESEIDELFGFGSSYTPNWNNLKAIGEDYGYSVDATQSVQQNRLVVIDTMDETTEFRTGKRIPTQIPLDKKVEANFKQWIFTKGGGFRRMGDVASSQTSQSIRNQQAELRDIAQRKQDMLRLHRMQS